jgi:hypothetical protein
MTENETDRQPDAPRKWGGRLWKWTKRVLLGFVGLVVVVLLAGVIYQFVATRLAYRNYPAPGRWSQSPATTCTSTAPARPAAARPW